MKINRLFAIIITAAFCGIYANAQNGTLTPYSRYGYGILSDNSTSMQHAMGGIGYAMNSGRQINVKNPASYAAIDSLTFLFDMGANFTSLWSEENGVKENNLSGGLDYITMAFPLSKRMGASIGLLPFSTTGYSFSDSMDNGSTSHTGSGSISEVYVGAAINPFANLYLGFNFAYMFGSLSNDVYAYTITGSTSLFERFIKVTDWRLDFGMQYPIQINQDSRLTLGLSFSPGKGLHGETYGLYYDAGTANKVDTIGYTKLNGKNSLPATWGGGVNYMWRERLMMEADFTYQPWKDAKYTAIEDFERADFANRWKVALGAQYTPNPRGTWSKRMQYRIGTYYNRDYIMVRGNNVREFGITAGLGLPITGYKSMLNIGVEYKHRQASPQALIKENYVNITLGINFNEMWFRKSRIY